MALKIVIIDDEKHATETLEWQLNKCAVPCSVVGTFHNPEDAITAISNLNPDLVLLDIEMPGMNGFQLLEKLNKPELQVIFTTAYDHFAVKAFRVNAVDYLLKPIDDGELTTALQKVLTDQNQVDLNKLKSIFDGLSATHESIGKLALPSIHGIDFIEHEDIIYCKSESNYTRIYLIKGQKLLVSKTLKEIELMLPSSKFFRTHNSFVANLQRVSKLMRNGGGSLLMENGAELKISRQRKDDLLKRLTAQPSRSNDA